MTATPRTVDSATLRSMPTAELMTLFAQLPAPPIEEMRGEYTATVLRQPYPLLRPAAWLTTHNPIVGQWRAKAFNGGNEVVGPGADETPPQTGHGYNAFDRHGGAVQHFPMLTTIAPSRFDGAPAFQLVYKAFNSACGWLNMVDEVRIAGAGLYLGIGTLGFARWQRMTPMPFELAGPVREYRGDIGQPRGDFDLTKALTP